MNSTEDEQKDDDLGGGEQQCIDINMLSFFNDFMLGRRHSMIANRFNAAARGRQSEGQVKCSNRYSSLAQDKTGENESERPNARQ